MDNNNNNNNSNNNNNNNNNKYQWLPVNVSWMISVNKGLSICKEHVPQTENIWCLVLIIINTHTHTHTQSITGESKKLQQSIVKTN